MSMDELEYVKDHVAKHGPISYEEMLALIRIKRASDATGAAPRMNFYTFLLRPHNQGLLDVPSITAASGVTAVSSSGAGTVEQTSDGNISPPPPSHRIIINSSSCVVVIKA